MYTQIDSTILCHRGLTVRLFPNTHHYVYLLHFKQPLGNRDNPRAMATHYMGSSSLLEERLQRHAAGNGSAIMTAVHAAGITWELARLWEVESKEAAIALEFRLKRRKEGPRLCPLCQGKPVDELVFMRRGHPSFSTFVGRRRPMPGSGYFC